LILQGLLRKKSKKISRAGDFLRGENSKAMTGVEIMNLAKKRVMLRNSFKWHKRIFIIAAAIIIPMFFLSCSAQFWIGSIIFGWGVLIIVHSIYVCTRLLDANTFVSEEYYRLKRLASPKNKEA